MKRTLLLLGLAFAAGACAPEPAADDDGMMDEPVMEHADSAGMDAGMDAGMEDGMDDGMRRGLGDDLNDGMSQDSIDGGEDDDGVD